MSNIIPFKFPNDDWNPELVGEHEPFRRLILHQWPENFSMPQNPDFLEQLLENLDFRPKHSQFTISTDYKGKQLKRNATFYKNTKIKDILSRFTEYETVHLHKSSNRFGWFTETEIGYQSYSHVIGRTRPITQAHREYAIGGKLGALSIQKILNHLRLLCTRISPAFGYSIVRDESSDAALYQSGFEEMSWDKPTALRARELGDPENQLSHIGGKLHDVYELNVLSNLHLSNLVNKTSILSKKLPLDDWIQEGNRGNLFKMKDKVFAWVVPKSVRQNVRERLLISGILTTKVPMSE